MHDFVHAQNLVRYVDLLEHEADPVMRERLKALLLEEENRFGRRREAAIELDGLVAAAAARVIRQRQIVGRLTEAGGAVAEAERLLATMTETLRLLRDYQAARE